ncbi:hypothetical protein ES705_49437 [subsurface metagenome]
MTTEIQGTFKIKITGKLLAIGSDILLKERASNLIRKIDPGTKLEERNFARIKYSYTWTGIPKNFGAANSVLKFLTEDIGKYLLDWETDIEMQLIESGE